MLKMLIDTETLWGTKERQIDETEKEAADFSS